MTPMPDPSQELRECPFCGGEARKSAIRLKPVCECKNCGVMAPWGKTMDLAIAAWNNRPSPWRPIADAEKVNGRSYLLSEPEGWGHPMEGCWDNSYKAWGQIQANGGFSAFHYQPTHYMPLPPQKGE